MSNARPPSRLLSGRNRCVPTLSWSPRSRSELTENVSCSVCSPRWSFFAFTKSYATAFIDSESNVSRRACGSSTGSPLIAASVSAAVESRAAAASDSRYFASNVWLSPISIRFCSRTFGAPNTSRCRTVTAGSGEYEYRMKGVSLCRIRENGPIPGQNP